VPLSVTGEPATVSQEGNVNPTLVTVPLPATVTQVPSPRQKVEEEAPVPLFICETAMLPESSEKL
jgi:hypothetical protein